MAQGYFLAIDLLGFGNIIRNSNTQEREERIGRWIQLIDGASKAHGLERVQLISDTVFVGVKDSVAEFQALVKFARHILMHGVRQSLPVRGAIVFGEHEWGRLTYGSAVVAAHDLEMSQNWIGVTCGPNTPNVDALWGFDDLIAYAVPFKQGPITIRPAVAWDIPPTRELANLLAREGLMKDGDTFSWALGEKLNNTIQFKLYRELLKRRNADPRKFLGATAMELIELTLTHVELRSPTQDSLVCT